MPSYRSEDDTGAEVQLVPASLVSKMNPLVCVLPEAKHSVADGHEIWLIKIPTSEGALAGNDC